ncbi:hypothetical protein Tco_0501755 [Tanacetum coccineum]
MRDCRIGYGCLFGFHKVFGLHCDGDLRYVGAHLIVQFNGMSRLIEVVGTVDFVVLEDMDAYRDEGMDDVIFGEPFLREVGINAKRCEGMITIHNVNEEVTYQMARSHLRTSLKEKKLTMLVENLRSGNLEVLES